MAQYLDASFSNEYRSSLSKTVVTLCHGLSVKLAGRGGQYMDDRRVYVVSMLGLVVT